MELFLHAQDLAPFLFTVSSVIIHINKKQKYCVWAPYLDKFRRHFPSGAHHAQTWKSKNSIWKRAFKSKRTHSWADVFSVFLTPRRNLGRGFVLSVHWARIQQPLWRLVSATIKLYPDINEASAPWVQTQFKRTNPWPNFVGGSENN
jgi:hypothetical protein